MKLKILCTFFSINTLTAVCKHIIVGLSFMKIGSALKVLNNLAGCLEINSHYMCTYIVYILSTNFIENAVEIYLIYKNFNM